LNHALAVNPATLRANALVERQLMKGLADFRDTASAQHQPLVVAQVIASYRASRRKPKRSAAAAKSAQTCPTGVTRTPRVRSASPRRPTLPLITPNATIVTAVEQSRYASLSSTAAMGASASALASLI
jgi:hypothetical protein